MDTWDMIVSCMLPTASCLVVGFQLGLGLDLVSGWLVVMHTYLYYNLLSLCHTLWIRACPSF